MKKLTRQQFVDWASGKLKIRTEGININPEIGFDPRPEFPPKAPPRIPAP